MKPFRVLLYPDGPDWGPHGPPESFGIEKNGSHGSGWEYTHWIMKPKWKSWFDTLRNGCGGSRCPVGASVGKLAVMLVVLTVATWAPGAPNPDKDKDNDQPSIWVYQHTYDEVFQASLEAIERMGLFVTDKDKDKGTISGSGNTVIRGGIRPTPWTFDIQIEALNTKPETRIKIDCRSQLDRKGKRNLGFEAYFRRDLSSEVQKVLATYH